MNICFLIAIALIESNGNACAVHANPKIHGSTGMSVAALSDLGLLPSDVHCSTSGSYSAAWAHQLKYKKYTRLDPWSMAILHSAGIGNFLRGYYSDRYMQRFARVFDPDCEVKG